MNKISQYIECDKLLANGGASFRAPKPGKHLTLDLISPVLPQERFVLDLFEGQRSSAVILTVSIGRKVSMHMRKSTQMLVRIDIDEKSQHTNPDGTKIRGSHVHLATEEYGTTIAYPLKSDVGIMVTGGHEDVPSMFESFRGFCHIDTNFRIEWTLGI